jgi:hypothetical protein
MTYPYSSCAERRISSTGLPAYAPLTNHLIILRNAAHVTIFVSASYLMDIRRIS